MRKTALIITALMLIVGFSDAQTYQFAETFYNDGLPKVIKTFKESKDKFELVKSISLYENGQKSSERTYKGVDSSYGYPINHGKWTYWHSNGQKSREQTFKDGKLIKEAHWDEDGNVWDY
jgi:antitoxin component YwqK of YwqJK toxin-antitoxin module